MVKAVAVIVIAPRRIILQVFVAFHLLPCYLRWKSEVIVGTLQGKMVPSESDKKYRCDCGVSFSSEVTLNGHKKYYCHNNANQAAPFREPQRKVSNSSTFFIKVSISKRTG